MADELFIAFDSSCRVCRRFAMLLTEASGGKIQAISLSAAETRRLLARVFPQGFKDQPYLIAKRGDSVRASAGLGLVLRVGRLLGWRRSWRLLKEVRGSARRAGNRLA